MQNTLQEQINVLKKLKEAGAPKDLKVDFLKEQLEVMKNLNKDIIELKICKEYYDDITLGKKRFEVRLADKDYKVGDIVKLHEVEGADRNYTGKVSLIEIVYILSDERYCLKGYIIFGFKLLGNYKEEA